MKTNSGFSRPPFGKATSSAPVTRNMILTRTRELALRAGRIPPQVDQADYEEAKRELTGETETDRQNSVIDKAVPAPPSGGARLLLSPAGSTNGNIPALLQLMR